VKSDNPSRPQKPEYGESWGIAMTLLEKPLPLDAISEQFRAFTRRFGFFGDSLAPGRHRGIDFELWLDERLAALLECGWVEKHDELYALTAAGREQARRALAEVEQARSRVERLATPQNASKLTLIVHLLLAAVKLPAGILSGSVGLLNDALDTLLDGVSSLLVFWGLKADRERLVSRLLVLFMLTTGLFTLFQAVRRTLLMDKVEADWFAFAATLISAAVCALLWLAQRFIGLRAGSMALITQSVDSRNHVIVGAGVTAGLIAALLRFPWLDYLVGLAVAVLILKSGIELAVELIRCGDDEKINLSRYRFGIYERLRRRQLCAYMLYLVHSGEVDSSRQLEAAVRRSLDFRDNVFLKSMGAERLEDAEELIAGCFQLLREQGLLHEEPRFAVTPTGLKHLAANRMFLQEGRQPVAGGLRPGSIPRAGLSLLARIILLAGAYWLLAVHLLPRLPALPLWRSLDAPLLTLGRLELSRCALLHLIAAFCLTGYAAVRLSLIYQRHPLRERRGKTSPRLCTEGFYARVRHPMTGTRLLFRLALLLALPSGWALIPLPMVLAAALTTVLVEERKALLPCFGDRYREYRRRVRSFFFPAPVKVVLALLALLFAAGLFV
jgi:protein-S-isoprenylcysteine O-methyltransferase Ste14/Co/Zn/Cd efflux system component